MNRGRGRNRTAVSLSITCPLFESDLCDCIALFDALTTTTAAAVHDLVWGCHPTFVLCFFASW